MYCLDDMPIPFETVKSGKLDDFLLPDEGFSKEEADERDEERRKKELDEAVAKEAALSPKEREERMTEAIETVRGEFEETRRILEAPPGYDFVPGIDDEDEQRIQSFEGVIDSEEEAFLEAADEERKEALDEIEKLRN